MKMEDVIDLQEKSSLEQSLEERLDMDYDYQQYESFEEEESNTLEDNIVKWKETYNNVFKTVIEDEIYIWRKLKRSEYKEITKMVSEAYVNDTQAQNWFKQEEITKTVLLYPYDAEEAIEESAGISVVISQDCLVRSGFGAISTQA